MPKPTVQQWKQYNPLDKGLVAPNVLSISNTLPFSKDEVSKTAMLRPKRSTVGVYPARSSMEVEDMNVMMVGGSIQSLQELTDKDETDVSKKEFHSQPVKTDKKSEHEGKPKMPAIVGTEGTTIHAPFAIRARPPAMPRSQVNVKKKRKITAPPNSSSSMRRESLKSSEKSVKGQKVHISESSPILVVPSPEEVEPTQKRSIDDMIQSLRSSRQASGTQKSLSDLKIDQLLQQVMNHAEEWMHEKPGPATEESPPPTDQTIDSNKVFEPKAEISRKDEEIVIEVDVSDTVSTLASQISAPAGIPDVSSILLRKSSHALPGTGSLSETSSPVAMLLDEDVTFDYEQAIHDVNLSLDVKNDDVLNVHGGFPALLEKTARLGPKDSDDLQDRKPKMPKFTSKGKIHRLCLLPSIGELEVKPHELALTKVGHAGQHSFAGNGEVLNNIQTHHLQQTNSNFVPTKQQAPANDSKSQTVLDSSKLDPLDIDGWRRLVEAEFSKKDYTIQGLKMDTKDWGVWRLMWTVAPPKMGLSTSAVKALVFPRYHGTLISSPNEPVEESWQGDDDLSDIVVEDENKTEFNERTLNRRHNSVETLNEITHEKPKHVRSKSTPNIHFSAYNTEQGLVKTDYVTAMEEINKQKDLLLKQNAEKPVVILEDIDDATNDKKKIEQDKEKPDSQTNIRPSTEDVNVKDSQSSTLATKTYEGGRSYVMYSKKKLKPKRSKKFVQTARKLLLSYEPTPLQRSSSIHSFFSSPKVSIARNKFQDLPKRISRSTSQPRLMDFKWFVNRHQAYPSKIDDIREWVRGIWDGWFDEIYPPSSDEESSYAGDDLVDGVETTKEKKDGSQQKIERTSFTVPDVIPPAVVLHPDNEDEIEDEMQKEVESLTEDINKLSPTDTSRKACHLARRGTLFRKLGNIKQSLDDVNSAIAIEPRLTQAYWQRHLIHKLKNEEHDALDDLNALLKVNKKDVDAYRSRGDVFASLGDYTMAVVNYSQTIKLDPTNEEPYFQRASIFEKTGDMLLAMEDYASVVKLNPARTDALLKRAVFHFKKKSWHVAVADFTQLIHKEPRNAEARTYRGRAYAELKQHESALMDLSASIHLDPRNASAYYYRGALLRTAAPNKALQDLSVSLLLDDSEQNVLALLHRGILYSELKKYQEAMADFEQTLRLDHSLACAHVNIGLIHLQVTDNYWEAAKQFSMAIKGDPTYIRSYVCRSDAYAKFHDYKSAVRDITRAIHLKPTERHLYLRRGKLLLQLRQLKLAAFCVRHIATLDESLVKSSATQQAVVQSFLGNHTAAVDSLSAACRTKPIPHMYVLLSKALMKGKRFKEAVTNLKNALELSTLFAYGETALEQHKAPPESAEIHFLLGQCHTEMCDHTRALLAYNEALKINPNYAEAYYQRGLCRLKLDHSKGVQDLNRALALQPKLFEAYLSRAAFYCTKKRYSKAILNCNEALRLRPRSVRALLCRGALKYRISAYHHAITDLTQAIKLDKQCSLAYYNRAVCLHRMKKDEAALKDYSIILMLTLNDTSEESKVLRIRVFVNRALLYVNSEFQDARNAALDLEQAALLSPSDTAILHSMALCYHKLNDLEEAEHAYTRCLEVDQYYLAAYIGRGDAYCDAGKLQEAKVEYEKALRLNPSSVEARVHLGYNLQMNGSLQQAWLQFTSAIELNPKCQSALEGRAVTCLHAGDLDAAARDVSVALKCGAPTARLLTACGVVHQCQHDLHTAMAFYSKARALNPDYTPAHFNATVLYLRDRRFAEARECLNIVLNQDPTNSVAFLNRAITNVFLGNPSDALKDFKRAIDLDSHNAHFYYNRGNLHFVLKQYEDAEHDFNMALSIDPSDHITLKRRADVRGCLGNKVKAVEDYQESLVLYERKLRLMGKRRQ
uniref:Uncharacterized protein LOC100175887 n=1 Tax=Phallusia mammillata TaxID=59560 RepID=A0A6F9DH17_9ASCI|nr:uncharacterized protein LOC100175887 [Phallusia mammillata]